MSKEIKDEERVEESTVEQSDDGRTAVRVEHEEATEVRTVAGGRSPRRNQVLIVAAVAIFALIILIYALFFRSPAKVETVEAPATASPTGTVKFLMEQQWLIRMKLAQVEEQTVARQITATGRVIPAANRQAVVAPPVSGILAGGQMPRVGQRVAAGQVIAVVQQTATSAEQAQVRAAAAQVEAQNAQVRAQNAQVAVENARLEGERRTATGDAESARVRLELARTEAERAQRLYDRKAFSQRQLQAAQAELASAQAAYGAAVKRRDALAAARPVAPAAPSKINVGSANSSYTVRAPLGGYVTKVNKSLGEQVQPGEGIVEISNLDTVWIEAPIFERDLNRLGGNVVATFTTTAYPGQEFRGAVVDTGAVIDEQTRAATVVFQVPNDGRALRIGMQANVRLDAGESVTAMMVPKEAVLDNEGKKIVYVLLTGEEFQRREVTLGDEYGDKVAVLTGLEKGERVVTQGAYQIRLQELRPADAGAHSHET
ncbi:MAG TPA: efflux RND transporter periplasmic adaptor subunit [Pyrinomonadaceae bacterium]|jgi:RND family efflux transporter MFP subunit